MRVRFTSLGCRVNQYETQALEAAFLAAGYTRSEGDAEVMIVNSCTVTAIADRKTRQVVRRLRREHPTAVLVLTGCLPQASPDAAAALLEADIVTGTRDRGEILSLVEDFLARRERRVEIHPYAPTDRFERLPVARFSDHFQRAYLKIEDGCDNFCAYCIIPYARGTIRSLPLDEIRRATAAFVAEGYREIVLTGINLARYGADLGLRLVDAVEAVAEIPGEFRIRFGSVEPNLWSDADLDRLAACPKFCPQFHFPLQSGCDATLARMNRHYTLADYFDTVERVRQRFDHPAITTDIIVGFPGETEEEFAEGCNTVRRLGELGLLRAHLFEYSPRPGTPAAAMPDQISPAVKKQRIQCLTTLAHEAGIRFAAEMAGRTERVLVEANGGGYTDRYLYVTLSSPCRVGEFVTVTLSPNGDGSCHGEPIYPSTALSDQQPNEKEN